jgi:hypothetical protein
MYRGVIERQAPRNGFPCVLFQHQGIVTDTRVRVNGAGEKLFTFVAGPLAGQRIGPSR